MSKKFKMIAIPEETKTKIVNEAKSQKRKVYDIVEIMTNFYLNNKYKD
jgi:hypothetical protein